MRLFAKIFLCATLVISVALLLSGYLLITYAHQSAVSREVDRALNQFQYDKFTAQAGLIARADELRGGLYENVLRQINILRQISADLNGLTAFFTEDKEILYSQLPAQADFTIVNDIIDDSYAYRFQTTGDKNYIMLCGKLTQNDLTLYLLIATDISDVIAQKEQMTQSFANIYFITLSLSMVLIAVLSAFITRPINKMNNAASKIAQGKYSERLNISSNDEIGDLAWSFNQMADAIEDKIYELSDNARQKEDFVANFAHELKTPLTSVIGYADMLYQKTLTAEQIKDAAWYILNEGLRLEALSIKLLDLIVLNRRDFTLEETNAEGLLQGIVDSLYPVFKEKDVAVRLSITPAYVFAEYDLFKTLLLNLLDNAIKAGCDGIDIVGKTDGGRYSVIVSDNGRGIPAAELTKITEAFYMVNKSRSRKQHGAGLGLSLADSIARIHGRELSFKSAVGVGTVVTVSLKLSEAEEDDN